MEALARQAGEFEAAARSASARNVFAASEDSTAERADALDQRREALGYQYEAADASFALVVSKAMRNFTPHFKRIRYQVEVSGYGSIRHGSNTYARSAVEPSRSLLGAF